MHTPYKLCDKLLFFFQAMKKLILLACTILAGCSTYGHLTPIAGENQRVIIEDGHDVLYSRKQNLVAIAVPETFEANSRMKAYIQVGNGTPSDFLFSPEEIRILAYPGTKFEEYPHVYTYEELVAEERSRQMWMAIAAALSAAGNSMAAANAGYSYQSGTYSGNYYGNIYGAGINSYSGNFSGSYSGYTYDPAKAQMAQSIADMKNQQLMQSLMQNSQSAMYELSSTILKENTVLPGSICGGTVQMDTPSIQEESSYIEITVRTGEEDHVFKYQVDKVQ